MNNFLTMLQEEKRKKKGRKEGKKEGGKTSIVV